VVDCELIGELSKGAALVVMNFTAEESSLRVEVWLRTKARQ
jgi:hypothetical protein